MPDGQVGREVAIRQHLTAVLERDPAADECNDGVSPAATNQSGGPAGGPWGWSSEPMEARSSSATSSATPCHVPDTSQYPSSTPHASAAIQVGPFPARAVTKRRRVGRSTDRQTCL